MEGLTISEVAKETGFSPSALRYYEGHGLITPARTPAGYRNYDAASIETLRFIARAKHLGLSLDEISDLVVLLDDRRCAPVQDRRPPAAARSRRRDRCVLASCTFTIVDIRSA